MKIANIQAETDPGAAILDYREAIKGMNSLPMDVRKDFPNLRIEASIFRKTGLALKEIGKYQEALSYMEQSRAILKPFVVADPNDTRAGNDFMATVENEAECFEDRAEGVFSEEKMSPTADAANSIRTLSEARSLSERLLQTQPGNAIWRSTLGLVLVRMSVQHKKLRQFDAAREAAARGIAILKAVAKQQDAQGFDLDSVAMGLTIVEPEQFRDPSLAVESAERIVESSHHQKPAFLLTLAHVYRAAGQPEKARAAAGEGLGLLPKLTANTIPSRIRKQLQAELSE
jgi:tetratricopeptide (TPR) repeat protein